MNILDKEYDKLLFVHIPKTAGTSISKILNDNNLDNWSRGYPRHHDPYFYLNYNNQIDDKVFSFSVVRNPYTRTYSSYKQLNKARKTDISFMQYLNNILEKNISNNTSFLHSPESFYVSGKENEIPDNTSLIHLPQSFYVIGQEDKIQVTKLYKFENLKELENDLNCNIEFYNVGDYTKDMYNQEYSSTAIEIVKQMYDSDFVNFGYTTDFNSTREAK